MIRSIIYIMRAEFLKLGKQRLPWIALLLVAVVLLMPVIGAKKGASRPVDEERQSESDRPESGGDTVNGFELFSEGSSNAILVATLFMLMIASLGFSGEFAQGTIRTSLSKPVTRTEFFLGKAGAMILVAIVASALIPLVGVLAVGLTTGFKDVVDKRYADYIYATKDQMFAYARYAFILAVLPILAATAFGMLMSVLIESPGASAMAAVMIGLTMHFAVTPAVPVAAQYLPNSYLDYYTGTVERISRGDLTQKWKLDIIEDVGRMEFRCSTHPDEEFKSGSEKCQRCGASPTARRAFSVHSPERRKMFYLSLAVPFVYLVAFLGLAFAVFRRKDILS